MLKQTAHLTGMTEDFLFNIQSGYLEGFEAYRAFGKQDMCEINQDNYLWEGLEEYTYPINNEKMYIKSTSSLDLGIVIIKGLYEDTNGDWLPKKVEATLDGINLVTTSEMEFIRVFRIDYFSGTPNTDNVGEITLYNSNTLTNLENLKAKINISQNRSEMAQYTVPTDYYGFVYRLYRSTRKNQDADFNYQQRPFGSGFRTIGISSAYENSSQEDVSFEIFPPKTDFQIKVNTENNNTEARGSFHFIIVHKDKLELSRIE